MNTESAISIFKKGFSGPPRRVRERGVILVVTMLALLVLMITGIALIRSFDSSLVLSGNLAFKRDLVNEGEQGMAAAITLFNSGLLSTDAERQATTTSLNYSAVTLASDAHGIPKVLTGEATWSMATTNDITDSASGATIRYVIDRMCSATGVESTTNCVYFVPKVSGGGSGQQNASPANIQILYRISVLVTLPNNTQTYLQSTGYH
jgi:type IV pilus assembly protein PilX